MRTAICQLSMLAAAAIWSLCCMAVSAAQAMAATNQLDIALVPSDFPVGFSLLTRGQRQYVAYYDVRHNMTVACRTLDTNVWQYRVLHSRVGWDSHNYVVMAIDDRGHLHLCGNMHASPLVYFRTTRPWDIASLARMKMMVGKDELRCTYPVFMRGADNRLVFHYRDGSSGNGREIFNAYDDTSGTWSRLLHTPLTDGKGMMNAYLSGPARGPDGWFHLCWTWRDTPDCETTHDPSYARSRDLVHWETISGTAIALPLSPDTKGVVIDPVPNNGGIINGSLRVGFDHAHRPVASYIKYDKAGKTQGYLARHGNGSWQPRQLTNWDYRWAFAGRGSIGFMVGLGPVRPHGTNLLAVPFNHVTHATGVLIADGTTLAPVGMEKQPSRYPAALRAPTSTFPRMQVKWAEDTGSSATQSVRYVLRWETLPANRDQPRTPPLPPPSMLRLHVLEGNDIL